MSIPKNVYNKFKKAYKNKLFNTCKFGINKEDMEKIAENIDISSEIELAINGESEKIWQNIVFKSESIIVNEHKKSQSFLKRHYEKWGRSFDLYELFYTLTLKFTVRYCQRTSQMQNSNNYKYQFCALKQLHGRACQIYSEIFCLISNGFADGAYARWRTLYELLVIVDFIKSKGEIAAKAFIEASFIDTQHCNWANKLDCFKQEKKVSFHSIEKTCNFNKGWMKEYKTACKTVHASPEGTFGRISNGHNICVTPVGRSDTGINIPATHACITLSIINAEFLTIFSDFKTLAELKVLLKLQEHIIEAFSICEEECFGEKIKTKITQINPALT